MMPMSVESPAVDAMAWAATPTPPAGGYTEPWEVSPGVAGFLAFFVLALALAVIARFMMRSVRRIDHGTDHRPSAPVPEGGIARRGAAPRGATTSEDVLPDGEATPAQKPRKPRRRR